MIISCESQYINKNDRKKMLENGIVSSLRFSDNVDRSKKSVGSRYLWIYIIVVKINAHASSS